MMEKMLAYQQLSSQACNNIIRLKTNFTNYIAISFLHTQLFNNIKLLFTHRPCSGMFVG